MLILGIETSCDETAAAVVQGGTKIIASVVASSQTMHAKYGGIIPDQAAREQLRSIIPVIQECLLQSNQKTQSFRKSESQRVRRPEKADTSDTLIFRNSECSESSDIPSVPEIDALAVTIGPGLIGSLLVGVETAKSLALAWKKPLIPVNHLVGHIYANWITSEESENSDRQNIRRSDNLKIRNSGSPSFPALVLLVSGGHTELILMKDHGQFKLVGSTRDDAAGECFDKCARILNLGYPGGPAIERAARQTPKGLHPVRGATLQKLPRPMINDKNFDFSFSGLKTAVLNRKNEDPKFLAHELQEAITDVLVRKTLAAAEKYSPKSILLAGGVAANSRLREKLKVKSEKSKVNFSVPPVDLCTDNAAYIASAAYFNYYPVPWGKINADPELDF